MTDPAMLLKIERIVYPGERLAHWEGRTVFTDEGLPGETVEAVAVRDAKGRLEARTLRIVEPSPLRIGPRCDHFRACGSYQCLPYPDQVELKSRQLAEILGAFEGISAPLAGFVPSPERWNYRNRVRFRVVWTGPRASLAYREPGSETEYVLAGGCHLVAAPINGLLEACRAIIEKEKLRGIHEVEARIGRAAEEMLFSLHRTGAARPGEIDPFLTGLRPAFNLAGILSVRKAGRGSRVTTEWGRDHIDEILGGRTLRIGAASFFQVNPAVLETVLEEIRSFAGGTGRGRLADIYCGLGTFGISLSDLFREVEGVESDPANIAFLRGNLERNGCRNFRIHEGRSEEWTGLILEKGVDLAVVDPPRKGLDPSVVRSILAKPPGALAYLSCHPATLARDLRPLAAAFRIVSVRGYDFFPQTPHIEALALLTRK
jgi:23S rRNA (uracil1939-C5)-methyltransferase